MGLATIGGAGGGGGTPPVADTTLKRLSLTPDALTGSSALSSLSIAQTWNTTGTPTAVDVDVTDTASNAASLLLNLRVGGVSKFSVNKAGKLTLASGSTIEYGSYVNFASSGVYKFAVGGSGVVVYGNIEMPYGGTYIGLETARIHNPTTATIQLGADHATTATTQTIKAHDVVTGTGANLVLAGGTGSVANGDVILDGENRAAFVADANALISFSGSDTVSLMTLESDFGALVSAFNALKATVISHGLMNPA